MGEKKRPVSEAELFERVQHFLQIRIQIHGTRDRAVMEAAAKEAGVSVEGFSQSPFFFAMERNTGIDADVSPYVWVASFSTCSMESRSLADYARVWGVLKPHEYL